MQEQVLTVSELTADIRSILEARYPAVCIKGEISNFRLPGSGHVYMTLKDADAQIPAVIWKSIRMRLAVELQDGMEIIARGRIEVYPPSGRYQLICTSVTPAGQGALQLAYALLLEKLAGKGYFLEDHKQPLPRIPETIGLITSPTGAVIEDMSNVLGRRFPAARLLLYPVKVQGEDAAENVISAITYFNTVLEESHRPDVLIIARGGGSLEDLQAFNEEAVAMAIFHSSVPVISAIGHETDVTIADMVADKRAGTPSIAAEIATPDTGELLRNHDTHLNRQRAALQTKIEGTERQVTSLIGSYAFNRPKIAIDQHEEAIYHLLRLMQRSVRNTLRQVETGFSALAERLALLDYRKTLERGYTLVRQNDAYITSKSSLGSGEATVMFHDGESVISVPGPGSPPGTSFEQDEDHQEC